MNLNAFISKSGFCSRRKAALLVKEGQVTVNGRVVTEPWYDVKAGDVVRSGAQTIASSREVYIVLNKPKGVTSTLDDRFAQKMIADLIPRKFGRVYPVGRLDRDSRGLIIMTNDGDLCHSLTHPKFEVEKEYVVTIKGEAEPSVIRRLKKGVEDEGDILKVKEAIIEKTFANKTAIKVVICEGKKRHLRRLFGRLGLDVVDLVRIRIGGFGLGDLRDGRFKILDKETLLTALHLKRPRAAA